MQRHMKPSWFSPRRGGRNPQQRADRARCRYAQVCGLALGGILVCSVLATREALNYHVAHTLALVCAGTFGFFAARWHRVSRTWTAATRANPPRR